MLRYSLLCLATIAAACSQAAAETPRAESRQALTRTRVEAYAQELRRAWIASGHAPDTTAPAIVSGVIKNATVDVSQPPASPTVTVKYTTGSAGLRGIYLDFVSPNGLQFREVYVSPASAYAPPSKSGSLNYERPLLFNAYSDPGAWLLEGAEIFDNAGNATDYTNQQLAALFPSLQVTVTNHSTPDTTAPTVSAGAILTPTVKLSSTRPYFGARLTLADNLSGVTSIGIFFESPSGSYGGADANPSAPVLSGSVAAYGSIPGTETGTYTIYGYQACDFAGNCLYDDSSADIEALFGTTTFTVTQ